MRKTKKNAAPLTLAGALTVSELIDGEVRMLSRYRAGASKAEAVIYEVRAVARRLESLARDVDRRADRAEVEIGLRPGERPYDPAALDRIATDVQHDVLWAVANLSLDRVAVAAQDFACDRRELEAHVLHVVVPEVERFARALGAAAAVAAECRLRVAEGAI